MNVFSNRIKEMNDIALKILCIKGIFLSGSLANNTFDSYSDIDLRYVIETNDLKEVIEIYKNQLHDKILFFEPCSFENAFIAHFRDFFKADVFFYTKDMLQPDPYLSEIKIIDDSDGFLKKLKHDSESLEFKMQSETFNFYVDKYIATAHECYRRVKRGEYLYANELLFHMKSIIMLFEDLIHDKPQLGFYKAERRLSKDLINFMYKNISAESDSVDLIMSSNKVLLNQLNALTTQGKNKRDINRDSYLLINWFIDFVKPL
jgi:hypothetical protein